MRRKLIASEREWALKLFRKGCSFADVISAIKEEFDVSLSRGGLEKYRKEYNAANPDDYIHLPKRWNKYIREFCKKYGYHSTDEETLLKYLKFKKSKELEELNEAERKSARAIISSANNSRPNGLVLL